LPLKPPPMQATAKNGGAPRCVPEKSAPGRRNPGEKLVGLSDRRFLAAYLSEAGPTVKRAIAQYQSLAPLERFLERIYWAVLQHRSRNADELARLGVAPFDQPSKRRRPCR
jgi:hypothetical protein